MKTKGDVLIVQRSSFIISFILSILKVFILLIL